MAQQMIAADAELDELLGLAQLPAEDDAQDVVAPALDAGVGRRVRVARKRAGLEAAQLAAAVGLSTDKLSKVEHGRRRVAPRELPALARALGVSMASLLGAADASRPALALAHRVAAGGGDAATTGARARAVELLEAEDRLSRQVDVPPRTLSPGGAAIGQLVATTYASTPRTAPEAQRQGRALAEEVRRVLELGVAEIGDLPALVEMHFAADVALSPLGDGSDGLCAHADDAALLVINTDFPMGRTRFTLAHELGHHLLRDTRDVIEEAQSDMYADGYIERRVNSFAGHLLLPLKAVVSTLSWLGVSGHDLAGANARGTAALGYLMVQFGVSLPCALQQVFEAGVLTLAQKQELAGRLRAGDLVRAAESLTGERPGPDRTLRDQRPPARLASAVVDAARAGAVGMHTVSVVLGRADDDKLFDEVMYGAGTPAMA